MNQSGLVMTDQIPEFTMASASRLLEEYCLRKVPMGFRETVDIVWQRADNEITIIQLRLRPGNQDDWAEFPMAQFRYQDDGWTLFCLGEDNKWQAYKYAGTTKNFGALLDIIDLDKTGNFWE